MRPVLGIGVPAPIYADKYDELGLGRNMLSRSLEDAGTLWAVMFPWTGCGAYQTGVLGMSPLVFFPYAFVNLLNPVYAYVTALFGRNIFWADGSYTNIFGKTKAGKPAGAPEEAHAKALANLELAVPPVRPPRSTRNLRPLLYLERNHRCETFASLGIRPASDLPRTVVAQAT